jgi:hypothetical protein
MNSSPSQQHIPARQANATPSANYSTGENAEALQNPPRNTILPPIQGISDPT